MRYLSFAAVGFWILLLSPPGFAFNFAKKVPLVEPVRVKILRGKEQLAGIVRYENEQYVLYPLASGETLEGRDLQRGIPLSDTVAFHVNRSLQLRKGKHCFYDLSHQSTDQILMGLVNATFMEPAIRIQGDTIQAEAFILFDSPLENTRRLDHRMESVPMAHIYSVHPRPNDHQAVGSVNHFQFGTTPVYSLGYGKVEGGVGERMLLVEQAVLLFPKESAKVYLLPGSVLLSLTEEQIATILDRQHDLVKAPDPEDGTDLERWQGLRAEILEPWAVANIPFASHPVLKGLITDLHPELRTEASLKVIGEMMQKLEGLRGCFRYLNR